MMTLDGMMTEVLDWACPQTIPSTEGWRTVYIETHCVGWTIEARKVDGRWEIASYNGEDL